MRVLLGNEWKEGFLDYYKSPKEYRIKVLAWITLEELKDVYHVRPKKVRMLWNYLPVVGPGGLIRKVWSRFRENYRNQKYVSCGVGRIIAGPAKSDKPKGALIGFIAPLHPQLVERIVLPEELIFNISLNEIPELKSDLILHYDATSDHKLQKNNWWEEIKAWSIYAGQEITPEIRKRIVPGAVGTLKNAVGQNFRHLETRDPAPVAEINNSTRSLSGEKSAVLFGYGNYAKINIIPYSKPFINIRSIHEIDPTEIFFETGIQKWDSSPFPRKDEQYDVYFVASYNHTHVPITLYGLAQGAYVVVEKPVAMDYEELAELEKALRNSKRGLFIGFHKRYSSFNKMALEDLGVKYGEPISYHCIVYELTQPKFFWYTWPVSRSTFFANGCHQIDHFLYLNDFSEPKNFDLALSADGTANVWIELANGAFFTMAFSEKGSSRVGPRDHVELKTRGRNVRITDSVNYFSENENKIIRRKGIFKTESYKGMYQEIGRKIANNENGDSWRSIKVSTSLMLVLEDQLQKIKKQEEVYPKAKSNFLNNFFPK